MSKPRQFEMETTRSQYKAIKKFDHQQLNIFVDDIYKKGKLAGYDAGYQQGFKTASESAESVPSLSAAEVFEKIAMIKGIGPKKLEEIKAAILSDFTESEEEHDG